MELEPGRVIERYEVVRSLGSGAMADVYLVRHTHLETLHALKLLTLGTSRQLRTRMLQEGRLQASLGGHPNVVAVTDVLEVEGLPALLIEYVDGESMDAWLASNRPSVDEALRIFRGIVAGVSHAHSQGLVHRDLKPGNVMLHRRGTRLEPKVADFGLAKAFDADLDDSSTRPGVAMGTPAYMAPEQIRDARSVDQRADVFALGCILYELVCGRKAFEGEDIVELFKAVCDGARPSPNDIVPGLPRSVVATIEGCLRIDAEARIQDCEELLATLDGASAPPGERGGGASATPGRATLPPGAPSVALVGGAGLVAGGLATLAILVVVLVGWWLVHRTEGPASDTDSPGSDVPADVVTEPAEPPPEADTDGGAPEIAPDAPAGDPAASGRCTGPRGQLIGYANVRGPFFVYRKGDTWPVSLGAKAVFSDYPNRSNGFRPKLSQVCTLPVGAEVVLYADPIKVKRAGFWVPIHGGMVR